MSNEQRAKEDGRDRKRYRSASLLLFAGVASRRDEALRRGGGVRHAAAKNKEQ
jgi:hypothetical protein